jgi:hypothetical protein
MEQYAYCAECRQGFYYKRPAYQGRVRKYCDRCKPEHDAKMNAARVAKHRASHQPQKQPSAAMSRPVLVGAKPVKRSSSTTARRKNRGESGNE